MTDLIKRYVSALFGPEKQKKDPGYYDSLTGDKNEKGYFWEDIDYSDNNISIWKCIIHLNRLHAVISAEGEDRLTRDEIYRRKILGTLDFWLTNDFANPNWWYNQIGVPHILADICLMADAYIDGERRQAAERILARGSLRGNRGISGWTGANLLWGIRGTVLDAMFLRDSGLLRQAVNRAQQEIAVAEGLAEGIKEDRSFYQHGPQLYSGGYGRSFTASVAELAHLFGGSEFQIEKDKLLLFCEFVLFGQRYLTRQGSMDYLCMGRELSRRNALSASSLRSSVSKMIHTPEMPHKDALRAYLAELEGDDNGELCDTRWFRNSYILCHHRPPFYMSVKGSHSDFIGTESGNYENYLGYNLTFGANTCFMADGKEYYNIDPLWDFSMLPGTTSFREDDAALLKHTGAYERWYSRKGTTDFCGGFSDGRRGVMYLKIDHDGLRALVSIFFFDFGMVALGTGITYSAEAEQENAAEIVTTVNQCFLDDASAGGKPVGPGETVFVGEDRISNGGFSYYNLCGRPLTLFTGKVTGNWKRNNLAESDEEVTRELFKLYFSHGCLPVDSSYAYAVCGGSNAKKPSVARIVNTGLMQAVELEDGSASVVFYQHGEYTTSRGKTVSASGGICVI